MELHETVHIAKTGYEIANKVAPQHMAAATATGAAVIHAAIPVVIAAAPFVAVGAAIYGIYRLYKEI